MEAARRRRLRYCNSTGVRLLVCLSALTTLVGVFLAEHRLLLLVSPLQQQQQQQRWLDHAGVLPWTTSAYYHHYHHHLHPSSSSQPNTNTTSSEVVSPSASPPSAPATNNPLPLPPPPLLSDLIGERTIKQEFIKGGMGSINGTKGSSRVQFLLDFVVAGFPKCATTYLTEWISNHIAEGVRMYPQEILALQKRIPVQLVKLMHRLGESQPQSPQFPPPQPGQKIVRGYKSPQDAATSHVLDYFAAYWPRTPLIVGLRNPVLWFESYYNFRISQNFTLPPADSFEFLGGCTKAVHGVCTDVSRFHKYLSVFGKTNVSASSSEQELVGFVSPAHRPKRKYIPNPVFLYEISQIQDDDALRADEFARDLGKIIGLSEIGDGGGGSLKQHRRPNPPAEKTDTKLPGQIDICEDRYQLLRSELMKNARDASQWILQYFVVHPDVSVSNPEYFAALLEKWKTDPCDDPDEQRRREK